MFSFPYSHPEAEKIWQTKYRYELWLKIELLVCRAWHNLGVIPEEDLNQILAKAKVEIDLISDLEKSTRHEMIAFLESLEEIIGHSARYIHFGLTSCDIIDTAFSLQLKEASSLILKQLWNLASILKELSITHINTIMAGRTHGIQAEPITFGWKLLGWLWEVERNIERLTQTKDRASVGKIKGAVGTYSTVPPEVEEYVCRELGLTPAKHSTQVIPRDLFVRYLEDLSLIGGMLERFALEIRNLQRTEIKELEEEFSSTQKGSSAMPHKRNPIRSERICGLVRILRGYELSGQETLALWHERDLSNSSVERIIYPQSFILCSFLLDEASDIIKNLQINTQQMLLNIEARGELFSSKLLLGLIQKGMSRREAYKILQELAFTSINEGKCFLELTKEKLSNWFTFEELANLTSSDAFLTHIPEIAKKFFPLPPPH